MILSMQKLSYHRQGKTILDQLSWEYKMGGAMGNSRFKRSG